MATILTYMHQNGQSLHSPCNAYWSTFVSFNTRQNLENQKVDKFQNSKWPPFWRTCTKMANFIMLLGSAYQYNLASFNTRKTLKIKKLKMAKIQNGRHFDVCAPKWPISKRRLVRHTEKISVKFRENISNFKDCITLTSSLVRISSLANLSKLATRGHHPKNSPGPFTMLV